PASSSGRWTDWWPSEAWRDSRTCSSIEGRATERGAPRMEFGYFAQAFVPSFEAEVEPGAEHRRLMENLDFAVECDANGIKYVWCPEHHFLTEYSHMPTPEVFLSFVAARTQRIHVGTAITNTTPPVNHPARVVERVTMLDHLSEGRFEFGTGRG